MVTPEELLAKRRAQIMDNGIDRLMSLLQPMRTLWIKDFIGRLAVAIRKIGNNK
jgi:hypothetical protein